MKVSSFDKGNKVECSTSPIMYCLKKPRTKVQASKETPYDWIALKNPSNQEQTLTTIYHKVSHMLPEKSLNMFAERFLNKLI